jgi:hypothetical protein
MCADTTIWRYMDLPRFISILANRGLWFTKAAALKDDPYEGYCIATPINIPEYNPGQPRVKFTFGDHKSQEIPLDQALATTRRYPTMICANAKDHIYVNSWCSGESESMAMWEIYGSYGRGLAVKSSAGQYRNAMQFALPPTQYAFGKVRYHADLNSAQEILRDFNNGEIPLSENLWNEVLNLGFHKRSCFEHEKEWRAAMYQDERPDKGISIESDLDQLISEIYIGPRAETYLFDVVSAIMKQFDLKKPLKKSTLLETP